MAEIQTEIDNEPLDGVNEGLIVIKDGKFVARKWCQKCHGDTDQHFCECGEEISAKGCEDRHGMCSDCLFIFHL